MGTVPLKPIGEYIKLAVPAKADDNVYFGSTATGLLGLEPFISKVPFLQPYIPANTTPVKSNAMFTFRLNIVNFFILFILKSYRQCCTEYPCWR